MNKTFKFIGSILIIIAFIVGLSNWIFGCIIYLVGLFLLLFSSFTAMIKLAVAIIPLILFYPTGLTIRLFLNNSKKESFYIPLGFEGHFRIIYGEKCGIDPENINGRIAYKIPKTRYLIVHNSFPEGWLDQNFYTVTNEGQTYLIAQNGKKTGKLSPSILGVPVVATINLAGREVKYEYVDFVVSLTDTVLLSSDSASRQLDSIVTKAVISCRSKNI